MQLINAVAIGSMIAMNSNTTNNNNMELEAQITFGSSRWFIYAGICCILVLFAGIMSGLALGLMSLSLVDLEILERSGTPSEKRQAAAILPVVQRQHQLLVTLLLCNASAVEALPIYLDKLFNQYVAILLSVTFVLAFGEVIPQAICTRYGLAVGARFIWLVRILMIICYPIAYPIGKVLDFLLGHHEALFRRSQLKALVSIHGKEAGKGGDLTHDETTIISGALDLKEKTAQEAMTPIESTFSLDVNSKLDREAMEKILLHGHSRVPVYNGSPRNLIGVLLVKTLLTVKPETETPVSAVSMRKIPRFPSDMPLYDVLNEFQKGNSHMAAVVKAKPKNIKPSPITDTVEMDENKDTNENSGLLSSLLLKSNENSDDTVETEKIQEQSYMNKQIFSQLDDTLPSVMPESSDTEELDENKDNNENLDLVTPLLSATNETADDTVETVKVSEEANLSKKNLSQLDNTSPSVMPCSSDDTEDGEVIGIITLEDVFEELLQEEIVDETDEFVDVHKRIRVAAVAAAAAAASSLARSPSFRKLASQKGAAGQSKFGQSMTKPSEGDPTSNIT